MGSPKKIKLLVLDTNVVISAILFRGESAAWVSLWRGRRFDWLVSGEILREYARVLAYPKFRLTPRDIRRIVERDILPFVATTVPAALTPVIKRDPADDKFLACALAGRADAIVSGDRHLLDLRTFRGIPILTVHEALEWFR